MLSLLPYDGFHANGEKCSTKSKMQTVEDVLKDMEINDNEEEFNASIGTCLTT